MFSSTNSLNSSPHFPPSSYQPFPLPFSNHHLQLSDEISLHQQYQNDPLALAGPVLPIPETVINFSVSNNPIMTRPSNNINIGNPFGVSNFLAKKPVKKDRHSKIYTSQGLRDRRVRLSIEIARKFFDLQDMLGFDKASKTLDWLLTKSRKAIKEAAKMKQNCNGCAKTSLSSTNFDCEVVSRINQITDNGGNLEGLVLSKNNSSALLSTISNKKMRKLNKDEIHLLAKESRAKARARARERTREKLCTRKCPAPGCSQILQQLKPPTQLEACERSSKVVEGEIQQQPSSHMFEESIMIRRKLKPAGRLGYQPNLSSSNNESSNYFPNSPLNWDINSTIARSSFYAITNTNLSTGIFQEQNIYIYMYVCMYVCMYIVKFLTNIRYIKFFLNLQNFKSVGNL